MDTGKHLVVNRLINQFQLEQKNTDILHSQLNAGYLYEPSKASKVKSTKIRNVMLEYPNVSIEEAILSILDNIAAVL